MRRNDFVRALPMVALLACATEPIERIGPVDADASVADALQSADAPIVPNEVPEPEHCAEALVEAWEGTAGRDQTDGYPDHVAVTVVWQRTQSVGCVDHYEPRGTATYAHAVPGALCEQWIEPATHEVVAADGTLTIDRTTSPATYTGAAATHWPVTWTCVESDGTTNVRMFEGGAAWFAASGTVAADAIGGEYTSEDSDACGPEGIAPCTYSWSFTPRP